jgi:hypothetical protein
VLPHGFVRIRFFGFLANRRRKTLLPLCQQLLRLTHARSPDSVPAKRSPRALWPCPRCGESMVLVQKLTAAERNSQWVPRTVHVDTS